MSTYQCCVVPSWNPWIVNSKATDQSVINSAVLVDCNMLTASLAAQTKYRVWGEVWFDTTAAADFKYTFVGPASPTLVRGLIHSAIPGAALTLPTPLTAYPSASGVSLVGTGTTGGYLLYSFTIHNGANAGTFAFRFAQNTATADTGAIVRAGSYMSYGLAA